MTIWWMTHLFQTGPASLWMTSAPTYLAIKGKGISAHPWHSDGFTHIGSGCKPGNGGRGAGSTIYLPYTTMVLEEICWWHMYSTPLPPGWLLSRPSEQIDPCIQFMMKKESDGQLPFLDILLTSLLSFQVLELQVCALSSHVTCKEMARRSIHKIYIPTANNSLYVRTKMYSFFRGLLYITFVLYIFSNLVH